MSSQAEPVGLPRAHVPRPRLIDKLTLAARGKLTMVCANAGYGKTTLLTEFARSKRWRTEWYYLTPADRDITRLAEGLEVGIRRLVSGREPKGAKRVRARQSGGPSAAILGEALLRLSAAAGTEPVLLVLDDFHNVDGSADVSSLLSTLVEGSPPSLHIAVLSRSVPHLLSRLKVRQEASVLGEKELGFTLDETTRFLREESQLELGDEEIAIVHARTEGWVAGIAMVAQSLRYGDPERVMSILADPAASAWLVYDYLAEEVFDLQETDVQQFLIKTSILNMMSGPACDYLLGSVSSQLALLALEEKGLFTASAEPTKSIFRYHPLFLEFLRQKLYQLETRESVETLHRLAAEYYERQGEWEECIHHFLKAGEPVRAARVIESIGERYIFSGFSQTVEHWLRALPEDVSAARPWLLALRGRLSNMSARYEDSLRLLERALRLFKSDGDEAGQAWAIGEIAYVRYRCGQLQESIKDFSVAISLAKAGPELRSQLLTMQAMVYRDAGLVEESVSACKEAQEELSGVADEVTRLWGHSRVTRNLALARMEMGRVEEAVRAARGAVDFCIANQIGEHEESWVQAYLGAVLWSNGEFEEAERVFTRALSLSSRYTRNLQQYVALWLGNSLRDAGRFAEAEQAYGRRTGLADLERAFASIVASGQGRTDRSVVIDLYRHYKDSDSLVARSAAEVVYAVALRKDQQPGPALEHVREAVRILKGSACRMRLASALFHQARIEFDQSRVGDARESLSRALEIAEADGYHHLFWWDPEVVAFLLGRALAENIFPDYAAELAERRLDSTSAPALAPLLQDRRSEVRQRAQAVLANLPQRGSTLVRDEILADCADPRVRDSLLRAVNEAVISSSGIQALRSRYGLSWRELEILVEYYLRPAIGSVPITGQLRKECAERLSISEYTVRCHVNSIRGKLSLPAWVSGKRVLDWAQQEGILPAAGRPGPDGEP